jgi:hypothetical protein
MLSLRPLPAAIPLGLILSVLVATLGTAQHSAAARPAVAAPHAWCQPFTPRLGGGAVAAAGVASTSATPTLYVKASNSGEYDNFGMRLAVDGDTMVVGAPYERSAARGVNGDQTDNSSEEAGAAYVFVRTNGIWSQQAYLKASNTDAAGVFDGNGDLFGSAVAIAGDTIVVGAPHERSAAQGINGQQDDNSVRDAGAAYVFVRNNGVWTQQAYLKGSNTEGASTTSNASDRFGFSVAVDGVTIVVGALDEDSAAKGVNGDQLNNAAVDSGAAYVFVRSGTTWSQQAYLKASNTDVADEFGVSVAVAGDSVAVGAAQEDSGAPGINGNQADNSLVNAGAVYVFTRAGTTWSQQAYLKAAKPGDDLFGARVALDGETLAVAATTESSAATGVNSNQDDNSAPQAGAAYVFVRSSAQGAPVWSQQAYLKASNTEAQDIFGTGIAINGDRIVVGAANEDSNATGVSYPGSENSSGDAGAAYVFNRHGTRWSQPTTIKASNTNAGDSFGMAVGLSGDTVVVGAHCEASAAAGIGGNQADNSLYGAGAVYVMDLPEFTIPMPRINFTR